MCSHVLPGNIVIPQPSAVSITLNRYLSIWIIVLTLRDSNLLQALVDHHRLFEGFLFLSGRCSSLLDLLDLS
jgi:hypothetical protein